MNAKLWALLFQRIGAARLCSQSSLTPSSRSSSQKTRSRSTWKYAKPSKSVACGTASGVQPWSALVDTLRRFSNNRTFVCYFQRRAAAIRDARGERGGVPWSQERAGLDGGRRVPPEPAKPLQPGDTEKCVVCSSTVVAVCTRIGHSVSLSS